MLQKFFKYHGAGNDFLLADNRDGRLVLSESQIRQLCNRHTGFGADGVILLESAPGYDFRMVFYNPDGSSGMMCGNGGRCIVAFAADLGVVSGKFPVEFVSADGPHTAVILSSGKDVPRTIRLKMKDVDGVKGYSEENACFLDTGTRHLVKFVEGLADYPVVPEGSRLRSDERFAPEGTNVDFVEVLTQSDGMVLKVRTFEKGVEDETLACGTGIVACAVAAYSLQIPWNETDGDGVSYPVRAAIADLSVDFVPEKDGASLQAHDIWLTGPAAFVGTVECIL